MRITPVEEGMDKTAVKKVADLEKDEESPTAIEAAAALDAAARMERARDGMMTKGGDATFTNVGFVMGITLGFLGRAA